VMKGLNPQGVKVNSFKAPTHHELSHDFFWRHYITLPAKGEIGIFNRSHYENVLITKVHPELILKEKLPGINTTEDIDETFWNDRYKQIRRIEKNLAQKGTTILKFFLHLSKEEQKKRFLERIDDPSKNWKLSIADIEERKYWDDYQNAYENAIASTATEYAPWFIIPADDKWFARLSMASIIYSEVTKLNLAFPQMTEGDIAHLQDARDKLLKE
jgi:PPK2 family polyphosphate:nucleotide phosphotransferase